MITMNKKTIFLIIFLLILVICLFFFSQFKKQTQPATPVVIPTPTIFIQTNTPGTNLPLQGGGHETQEFKQAERDFLKNTPILQSLPSEDLPFFSIGYIDETHLVVYSKTTNTQRDYQEAKKWFVENNIDIGKITIDYK